MFCTEYRIKEKLITVFRGQFPLLTFNCQCVMASHETGVFQLRERKKRGGIQMHRVRRNIPHVPGFSLQR